MKSTIFSSKLGLIILFVVSTALIGITSTAWKGVRIDLTENQLYTLSPGSRNIVAKLDAPVTLQFYFSERQTEDSPQLRNYGQRIQALLQEFSQIGGDKIDLRIIDPEPFSEEEDAADALGMQKVRLSAGGDEFLLGLSGQREGGTPESIPFFHPDRESFLEQDISKLIFSASRGRKPVIGILSGLDVTGGVDFAARQPTPAWTSIAQLNKLYTVRTLSALDDRIADDIDLLMLVQPGALSDAMLYAIDQYVVGGGNAMVFADPISDLTALQRGPAPLPPAESSIARLLSHWGVELDRDQVIGDARHAVSVSRGVNRTPIRHLAIQSYGTANFPDANVVTRKLESLLLASAGTLAATEDSRSKFEPLLVSSNESMLLDRALFQPVSDPTKLYDNFQPTGEKYVLAARVSGEFNTAFPDGYTPPPPESDEEGSEDSAANNSENQEVTEDTEEPVVHISSAQGPAILIVVADSDILTDRLWVRVQNFFGQQIAQPFADNGDFVLNATDNLLGNADLISIRGRGHYGRPFTVVEDLRREADARFQNTERALMAKLDEAEAKLAELQQQKGDDEDQLALNEEQIAEIEKFQAQKLQTRKELREVRHQLGSDIEDLGSRLKFINTALMPILLTLGALLLRRRKQPAVATT